MSLDNDSGDDFVYGENCDSCGSDEQVSEMEDGQYMCAECANEWLE